MHFLVVPPIGPGMQGPQVVNVGRILKSFVERGVLTSFDPPDTPTTEELQSLAFRLSAEIDAATFGQAIQRLLVYLQIQNGLGDQLRGSVEESTARLLKNLVQTVTGEASTAPPPDIQIITLFIPSLNARTLRFRLRYRLDGDVNDRLLSLTPSVLSALLALKFSAKYFAFDLNKNSFVATEDLLR